MPDGSQENEGIQPTAQSSNGMYAIAHCDFRVDSWAARRIASESMARPSFLIRPRSNTNSAAVFCCAVSKSDLAGAARRGTQELKTDVASAAIFT